MALRMLISRLATRLAPAAPSLSVVGAPKGNILLEKLRHPLQLRELLGSQTNFLASLHRGFTSSASEPNVGNSTISEDSEYKSETKDGSAGDGKSSDDPSRSQDIENGSKSQGSSAHPEKRKRGAKPVAFSDSDAEADLTPDELVRLVMEKDELLEQKNLEIKEMKDKVLRTYAEMENMIERQRRESENSKKFAIQNFSKSLLDVADNLTRALSVVKESLPKIDSSQDSTGSYQLLKNLLEGIEMTEKQLLEVFRKFGVEKFDPLNESFDPNRHNAVFQIPDASKPPGTVAAVLKVGYMLHDRVLRPAEVGVTQDSGDASADSGNKADV